MDTIEKYIKISTWIAREIAGTIQQEEKEKLEQWLGAEEENLCIYENIRKRLSEEQEKRSYQKTENIRADWNKVQSRLKKKTITYRQILQWAAIIIVMFSTLLIWKQQEEITDTSSTTHTHSKIYAGKVLATLTLDNGEEIKLQDSNSPEIHQEGIKIYQSDNQLVYEDSVKNEKKEERFHVISVPRGGEYCLKLSDGTIVYLNAESKLIYPVTFSETERKVHLVGEAFFDVQKDTTKPFIVDMDSLQIRVLGTEFGVRAYTDEECVKTTLKQGSVKVETNSNNLILSPGTQAIFKKSDHSLERQEVNITLFIGWKDGRLIFKHCPLEEVLRDLGRWYNFNVTFEREELRSLPFSLNIEKHEDFSEVLNLLEETECVTFEITDNTVIVK